MWADGSLVLYEGRRRHIWCEMLQMTGVNTISSIFIMTRLYPSKKRNL